MMIARHKRFDAYATDDDGDNLSLLVMTEGPVDASRHVFTRVACEALAYSLGNCSLNDIVLETVAADDLDDVLDKRPECVDVTYVSIVNYASPDRFVAFAKRRETNDLIVIVAFDEDDYVAEVID